MAINAQREFAYKISLDNAGLESDAQRARHSIESVGDGFSGISGKAAETFTNVQGFFGNIQNLAKVSFGAFAGSAMVSGLVDAGKAMVDSQISAERLKLQLSAGFGSANVAREFDYVTGVASRLGVELLSTSGSYAKFAAAARGTSLQGEGVRQVFEAVTKASTVMGLTTDETQGSLRALEQMMSKGVVQAEELRGQLGDRMPGALQIAARAMGVTTRQLQEMMKEGELITSEFLPKFAAQLEKELGGALDTSALRMQEAVNKMKNAWELFGQERAASGGGSFLAGQMVVLADGLTNMTERMNAARIAGGGWLRQMNEGAVAVIQFLNPLNVLGYEFQAAEQRMKRAGDELVKLKEEFAKNPESIYIKSRIGEVEALINRLAALRDVSLTNGGNQLQGESAKLARQNNDAAVQEEQASKLKGELSKVTETLTKKNIDLANSMRILDASRAAGYVSESKYLELAKAAKDKYTPKERAERPAKPEQPKEEVGPPLTLFDREQRRMEQQAAQVEQFFQGKVAASDKRVLANQQRISAQAQQMAEKLRDDSLRLDAELIQDAEGRAQALLAIEKANLTSRIEALGASGEDRKALEAAAAQYILDREKQLTEELKPEWQRRVESWSNTTVLMRDAYDTMMSGFIDRGRETWLEFLKTGKLNTRALVNFIGDELAKLAYNKAIGALAGGGGGGGGGGLGGALNGLLGMLGLGGIGSASGGGYTGFEFGNTIGGGGGGGYTGFEFGTPIVPGLATGGGARAGAVHRINESGEPEVYTASNGRRYLLPGQQGWVSTMAASQSSSGGGGGGGSMVQNITYNVPPGTSPAEFKAMLDQNNRQQRAQFAAEVSRPGRSLQRAVAAGMG